MFTARYGLGLHVSLASEALNEIQVLMTMFVCKKIRWKKISDEEFKMPVFMEVTPCILVPFDEIFGGVCSLSLEGRKLVVFFPPKRQTCLPNCTNSYLGTI